MRIITISREFGSGGRELGKRLADALGVPCYDQQIIDMIAQKKSSSGRVPVPPEKRFLINLSLGFLCPFGLLNGGKSHENY